MIVKSIKEAWRAVDKIFPTDYAKDDYLSERAGYDIFCSTADGVNAWISDLNNRLEVNLENGETVNIWVETMPTIPKYAIEDTLLVLDNAIYDIEDKVDLRLRHYAKIDNILLLLEKAYETTLEVLADQYPDSELAKRYGV